MESLAGERVNLPRSTDQDQHVAWSHEEIIKHRIFAREKGLSPTEILTINQWDELNVNLSTDSVHKILEKVANKNRNGRYMLKPELLAPLDVDTYPYKASCRKRIKERATLLLGNSSNNRILEATEATPSHKKRGLDKAPIPSPKWQQRIQIIDLTSDAESELEQLALPAISTPPFTPEEDRSQVQHTIAAKVDASDKAQTSSPPHNETAEGLVDIQTEQVEAVIEEPDSPSEGKCSKTRLQL